MNPNGRFRSPRIALLAGLCAVTMSLSLCARADEPVEAFLEGLHQRQMFDMAIEYLDMLPNNPLVSEETKITIPYHRGRALVEQARLMQDVSLRLKQLDRASQEFANFASSNPDHPLAGTANIELGNVMLERGRTKLELAKRPSQAQNKKQLEAEAQAFLEEAKNGFTSAQEQFKAELDKYPAVIDPDDQDQMEGRRNARTNLIRASLLQGEILYESSKAYGSDKAKVTDYLNQAVTTFAQVYEDYRRMLAGLYARMWQARCLEALAEMADNDDERKVNTRKALAYYDELLAQPDEPAEFRDLKRKVLRLAMKCWLSDQEKRFDQAIRSGTDWLQNARPGEDRTAEGLSIRWLTAQAHERRANEAAADDAQKNRDLREAADLAGEVARFQGDHQADAKTMIARLRNLDQTGEPATFAEARDKGKAALDAMEAASTKLQAALSADMVEGEKVAALEQELAAAQDEALRYCRLALDLRDAETPVAEVNQVRYFLSYLAYRRGAYYDAAVLAEFVARNYPDGAGARPAARIAMAAYRQAYNDSAADQRDFETQQMVEIAKFMAEQWPDETEAEDAWIIMAEMAMRSGEFRQAAAYLENIKPESARRAEADLKAGQALSDAWRTAARLPEGERPSDEELDELAAQSEALLARGISKLREDSAAGMPDYAIVSGELDLARLYLRTSRFEEALEVLSRPDTGALALVAAKAEVAQRGNFAEEVYKTALRAYVGSQQLEQAKEVMAALDELVQSSPDASARLTRVYLELGQELEEEVAALSGAGKQAELERVLASFEQFLDQIAKRGDAARLNELNWVADTFVRLGQGLETPDGAQSKKAQSYYLKASTAYEKLLEKLSKGGPDATPQNIASVKLRLAACQRNLKQYRQALLALVDVLAQMPKTLDVQTEIAQTYQEWGSERPEMYARAIQGRTLDKDGTTLEIWGWARLASIVQRFPEHRDTYFEARYKVAQCRYQEALTLSGEAKTAALKQAERDLAVTVRLTPPTKNNPWYARYDALLKQIQTAQGQRRPGGLSVVLTSTTGGDSPR